MQHLQTSSSHHCVLNNHSPLSIETQQQTLNKTMQPTKTIQNPAAEVASRARPPVRPSVPRGLDRGSGQRHAVGRSSSSGGCSSSGRSLGRSANRIKRSKRAGSVEATAITAPFLTMRKEKDLLRLRDVPQRRSFDYVTLSEMDQSPSIAEVEANGLETPEKKKHTYK